MVRIFIDIIAYLWEILSFLHLLLEGFQAFVDGHEFDDGAPAVDEELEGVFHFAEGAHDLLHDAEGDNTRYQGRPQRDVGKEDAGLQIAPFDKVEIEVVAIQHEVVFAHVFI